MFFRIIHFKSAGAAFLFFFAVFFMGLLWGFVDYNGLADALSNKFNL